GNGQQDRSVMAERFETIDFTRRAPSGKNMIRIAAAVIALLLIFVLSPFGTIAAGERGVHLRFTAVTGKVFGEGLYFRIPLIESVQLMDVKVQKYEMKSDAASKDLQTVHSVVALNFHIDPDRVANMYQAVGLQFKDRIIDPAMQEAIKASTAKFTAEELITRREVGRDEIKATLTARPKDRNILVDVVNFECSKNFNDAIEAKVTAEQQALAAKNKLEQIKFEADQAIAEARGKTEAITTQSNARKSNPQ